MRRPRIMEAYERMEVAELFYLDETLLWLALGRLPRPLRDSEGIDVRLWMDAHTNGYVVPGFDQFTLPEFEAAGIEVDFDRYLDARTVWPGFRTVRQYQASRESRLNYPNAITEIGYVEQVEGGFSHYFEVAKVRILSALIEGDLKAEGVRAPLHMSQDEIASLLHWKDQTPDGEVAIEPIPKTEWRVHGVQWGRRRLRSGSKAYNFIALEQEQFLALFPEPLFRPVAAAGRTFGGMMLREGQEGQKRHGTRAYEGGRAQEAVLEEFSARLDRGDLSSKKEAVTQEAIEWVNDRFGINIHRSTARRYLQPVLERMSRKDVQN